MVLFFYSKRPGLKYRVDKEKLIEKIYGVLAAIMTLDKSISCGNDTSKFVHDYRELIVF